MVRTASAVALCAFVVATAAAAAEPLAYSLGPYQLGMTSGAAMAVPMQGREGASYGGVSIPPVIPTWACSGDEKAPSELAKSSDELAIGSIACLPVEKPSPIGKYQPLSEPTPIKFGRIYLVPKLEFIDDKIVAISSSQHVNWLTEFREALTEKYGPPARVTETTAQNGFGATWPVLTYRWTAAGQTVTVVAPDIDREHFSVAYADEAGIARREAMLRSRKGSLGI